MTTTISGDTGVSQIQDNTVTSAKIVTNTIVAQDMAGAVATGSPTQYTAATTPLPSANTAVSVAHGLGAIPVDAVLEITCLTAEAGYSVGDVLQICTLWNAVSVWTPPLVWKSSSNVGFNIPSGYLFSGLNKSTGAGVQFTAANWSYRFKMRVV